MSQDSYPNIKTKSVLFLPYASQVKDFKKCDSCIFLSQKKQNKKKILQGKMVRSWTPKMQLVHFVPVLSSSLSLKNNSIKNKPVSRFKEIFFHHFESRIKIVF